MPGRQAHGRPLLSTKAAPRQAKKSRSRSTAKALDAFALAAEQLPQSKKGRRTRDLDPEPGQKRHRHDGDGRGEEDEDDEEGGANISDGPPKKRARATGRNHEDNASGSDYGSDSEGNEWRVGHIDEGDDSEIDSDEAFGEGDEERFEGFAFRGSSSRKAKEESGESGEEDGESLGGDAIDLAQALDQASDEDGSEGDTESGSEDDDDDHGIDQTSESEEDNDEANPSKLRALQGLVSGFAGLDEHEASTIGSVAQEKHKIGLKDLGLYGVKDPNIKRSLRLMNKEEKTKPRTSHKLDVPLARRQQDRLLRAAAFEKASETLDRWSDTVKHNRRAEHLFFPLPQTQPNAGLDNSELLPLTQKTAGSELEQTIMSIMEESGLGPSSKQQPQQDKEGGDRAPGPSRSELRELWSQRRRDRELFSREQARAKRIKKIKSKAYRRIHRKEQVRDEIAAKEAMAAEGGLDSEEEREAQDRRRAMERMGARHKESKWAKMAARTGRAAWDDDFREGLKDMARKDEELRRRVEGRTTSPGEDEDEDDHEDSDASWESEKGEKRRLLADLARAAADGEGLPESGLMGMKFMRRAEEVMKKANDDLIKEIRRDLDSGDESDSEEQEVDVGRRQYGLAKPKVNQTNSKSARTDGGGTADGLAEERPIVKRSETGGVLSSMPTPPLVVEEAKSSTPGGAGAWSRVTQESAKGTRKGRREKIADLDLAGSVLLAAKAPKPKQAGSNADEPGEDASDDDGDIHLPLAIRDQELVRRAFASDDVVGEFAREKAAIASDDDDKVVDNTLPGWGSWVGEGISNREKQRHQGRFLAKKDGVKKKADRRDTGLDRVIINERRVRKNEKYLASQLPHPFESRYQYERSLRLPVGPEWMTKESFQDATKPRVIIKQGIIAPIAKPLV